MEGGGGGGGKSFYTSKTSPNSKSLVAFSHARVVALGIPSCSFILRINCPVDGEWSSWNDWSGCNGSCGYGLQLRNRTCTDPVYSGQPCAGSTITTRSCHLSNCTSLTSTIAGLYVCMYLCMYVCTYVCIYVCMYVCIYACMYVCILYICIYIILLFYACLCRNVCIYLSMYVCINVCIVCRMVVAY